MISNVIAIHQPTDEIGQMAYQKLMKIIDNEPVEVRTILTPELIERGTSKK